MNKKKFELIILEWDTEFFGVKSAKVNLNGSINKNGQEEIIKFCKKHDFVTISNVDNKKENNYWLGTRTDAFLTDVNIQFHKKIDGIPVQQNENTYIANNFDANEQILTIASNSFNYSRFFNDPNLPQKQVANIYRNWTNNSFYKQSKYFVIYETEGSVKGYLLFSIDDGSIVIELLAVDKKHQGQNIGKTLILSLESFALSERLEKIKVGTQINNISAFRFYIKMGFKYFKSSSVYHLWKKDRKEKYG